MHGEYKIPGGKLVVVDLEVEGGALRDVRVAGDFFLEPDEAILAIDAALEGAPAHTDAAGLAARITAALPRRPCCWASPPRVSPSPYAGPSPGPPSGAPTAGS